MAAIAGGRALLKSKSLLSRQARNFNMLCQSRPVRNLVRVVEGWEYSPLLGSVYIADQPTDLPRGPGKSAISGQVWEALTLFFIDQQGIQSNLFLL